jgi:glycosyl transferase family 25
MLQLFVINLDRSKDRLDRIQSRLESQGFDFVRVPAIDGGLKENHDRLVPKERTHYFRPLVRGEIACYLSHLRALQAFLSSDASYGLILEDDAVLVDGFKDKLNAILDDHIKAGAWHLLKLDGYKKGRLIRKSFSFGVSLVEFKAVPGLATGIVWTRGAAKRFLNTHSETNIEYPIDVEFRRPWEFDSVVFTTFPPLVNAEDISSGEATTIRDRWVNRSKKHQFSERVSKWVFNAKFFLSRFFQNLKHFGLVDAIRLECGHHIDG